jgi:hypothetical protein
MIGLAKQLDGLYKFYPSSSECNLELSSLNNKACNAMLSSPCNKVQSFVPSNALWHFRLGHLSSQRQHTMSLLYPSIKIDNNKHSCDLCHFAKHKHLPFLSSTSYASKCFELIHLDIWGPISTASVHGHRYFFNYS